MMKKMEEIREKHWSPLEVRLYDLLTQNGPMTRKMLVNETNRAQTTVLDNLQRLIRGDMIKHYKICMNERGTPPVYYEVL